MLGDNVMFAVDQSGLTAEALSAGDPSLLNLGARFTGDKDAINDIYNKVESLIEQEAGGNIPFVKKDTDDGIVLASNDAYAGKLSEDGKTVTWTNSMRSTSSAWTTAASSSFVPGVAAVWPSSAKSGS